MADRPSAAEILDRARAMIPTLKARAAETEKLRRLPDETNREFLAAGFYKIMQPRRYGGYELDFGTQTALGAELGRGCGSSAWVATITWRRCGMSTAPCAVRAIPRRCSSSVAQVKARRPLPNISLPPSARTRAWPS